MKKERLVVLMITIAACCMGASAKSKLVPKIYGFGFAASFNDSIVYFTDIQEIDSAWIEDKTNFLVSRENYSYQLRDYLAEHKFQKNRTCVFTFALTRKDIDKKYLKMKKRYTDSRYTRKYGNFDVKYLTAGEFAFKAVAPMEIVEDEPVLTKKELKAKKKEEKKKRQAARKGAGRPGMPGGGMPPSGGRPPKPDGNGHP